MNHKHILRKLRACDEALIWYNNQDSRTAWETCPRGDWMLWIAGELGVDRKLVVKAACECAKLSLGYIPRGEYHPARVINTALAWCYDEERTNLDLVREAAAANAAATAAAYANAAATAAAAANAATYAAAANAAAAAAANAATYAAAAAANAAAANAATYAAAAAANAAAANAAANAASRLEVLGKCACRVRSIISWEDLEPIIESL